jgi:hypothetical protein
MTPTEADIRAYELRVLQREQRRQARRPALIAFRNLFGLMALGAVIYGATAFWMAAINPNTDYDALWEAPQNFYVVGAYIALVTLVLSVKNSKGHKIRTIARARRAQLYPGHPWVQFRIVHPYWSHVVFIGVALTALNVLGGLRKKL